MRDTTLDIIINNLTADPDKRQQLAPRYQEILLQVGDCYNLILQHQMMSRKELRNYLMNRYKLTQIQAYRIIDYANAALGSLPATHKNRVRQRVEAIIEESYEAAKAGNFKLSEQLTKLARVYAKVFAIDQDDGELIDAQKYLEIARVEIVMDPAAIGITISEPEQKEIDKMCRQYQIEDADFEEVDEGKTETP